MASGLGWDPLKTRRKKHIVKLVKNCPDGQAPSYFSDYFRWRTYDIHDYDTRSKDRLSIVSPLSPNSDQDQFSPNNIHTLSTDKL